MNKLPITILYHFPGQPPVMTTTVVEVGKFPSLHRNDILEQYRDKIYFDVTITEII